ncbi:DUF4007 family protein [Aestuariirhabdus litorea]|uniref:DUF4007 family protein n=1 Tax=Aestuariirhabdus litorea TaxID=2528527 RepID=A0A3P3VQY5_9GAMM|nr:DUF4007 family protein [Aestuariirhabdus litorea]RRJ84378.1 DUF4007 family protein [Aestuariirhabdus litorea]RWW97602.1 DUF4007 family protein [Endozoicomonadaceae bacterium GTF-13]
MKLNPKKASFGRHETFALRYGWLPKGYAALIEGQEKGVDVFSSDDATVVLGVGKNMVASIRYWLRACQIIDPVNSEPTEVGDLIFNPAGGYDPYLEDEATIWLLHWLLASNAEQATAWFWFFNKFHKPEFTSQELTTALVDFVKDVMIEGKKPSLATLKNDAQLIHRMYTQSKGSGRTPLEDALDSPLALLRLMSQGEGGRRFISRPEVRQGLPLGVLGFAVLQLMKQRQIKSIPIEELMYSRGDFCAPGAVFRLTENDLITKLEKLINYIPGVLDIRDTAGIHQLFLVDDKYEPGECLEEHYQTASGEVAA